MPKCDYCGMEHKRKRFCSNKCKDRYHNVNNPRGIYSHLKNISKKYYDPDDDCHPFSSEALGQQ